MKRQQLLNVHDNISRAAKTLMEAKNHDYSGGPDSTDAFLNFTRVENMGITDTKTGFLVRMTDKMSRLITYVQGGKLEVKDEALKDTIIDLVNYSILLYAYTLDTSGNYSDEGFYKKADYTE